MKKQKKLFKSGDSRAIIIPSWWLKAQELFRGKKITELEVTCTKEHIILTPIREE